MEASLDASLVKYKSKNLYFKGSTWSDIRDRLSVTKIDSKNLREREREMKTKGGYPLRHKDLENLGVCVKANQLHCDKMQQV